MPDLRPTPLDAHDPADVTQVLTVFHAARHAAMPWLPILHTPEEDRAFFTQGLRDHWRSRGIWRAHTLLAFVAYDQQRVHHLYVAPDAQRQGLGRRLLDAAVQDAGPTQLYCFADNHDARRFYEAMGWHAAHFGDGSDNEERRPDVRYDRPTHTDPVQTASTPTRSQ